MVNILIILEKYINFKYNNTNNYHKLIYRKTFIVSIAF